MPKMSKERVQILARDLLDAMVRADAVVLLKDAESVRQAITQALADELRREEEREQTVRARLALMKDAPAQGTKEWEQLFRRLLEEEQVRESLDA